MLLRTGKRSIDWNRGWARHGPQSTHSAIDELSALCIGNVVMWAGICIYVYLYILCMIESVLLTICTCECISYTRNASLVYTYEFPS